MSEVQVRLYKDRKNRTIDPYLFSKKAEELAKEIHEDGNGNRNRYSQLRKFYDEILRLNNALKNDSQEWEAVLPFVNMMIAKAVYAEARKNTSNSFSVFIEESIEQIERPEDLQVFTTFFESFMGFYRRYNNK